MSNYSNTFGGAAKDAANDTILGAAYDTQFDSIASMSSTKADKVGSATNNNLLTMDAAGNMQDSGVGVGALTTTELAILIGATVTTAELNTLDGITSTVTELNLLSGTSATTVDLDQISTNTSDIVINAADIVINAAAIAANTAIIPVIYAGEVAGSSATVTGNSNVSGFTCSHPSTGDWTLTHNLGTLNYSVSALSVSGDGGIRVGGSGKGVNSISFKASSASGNEFDVNWSFIIIPW